MSKEEEQRARESAKLQELLQNDKWRRKLLFVYLLSWWKETKTERASLFLCMGIDSILVFCRILKCVASYC